MKSEIEIYNYLDYRLYLQDLFEWHQQHTKMTLRSFSREAGFSSHTHIRHIIEGLRSLSLDSVWKVARGFGLDDDERSFLELLIRFDQAEELEEKNEVYAQIMKTRPREKASPMNTKDFHLFSQWHTMAIRELVSRPDFKDDLRWISKQLQPEIDRKDVKQSIDTLLESGYLKREENDKLVQSVPDITTGDEVKSLAVFNYHKELLRLGRYALENSRSELRDFSSVSFCITASEYKFIKGRLQDFRKELMQYLKDKRSEDFKAQEINDDQALYYLNMQLFNGSQVPWRVDR